IEGKDRNVLDICVHSKSKSIIVTGWRQASDWSERANKGGPVQIAFIRSLDYNGKVKWNAYDWSTDGNSDRYLNKPENNMADTRGLRCSIGSDEKLYVVFMAAGGNHIFRYSPFDITKKVVIPKGDCFNDFSATKSEHKTFYGRYNPENGEYESGQQLTARISPIKTNTLWCDEGQIVADKEGRVYLAGFSAYGLPIKPNKMLSKEDAKNTFNPFGAGSYLGGPFLIISGPDMSKREYVTRITPYGGLSRTVAERTLSDGTRVVVLGGTANLKGPAYIKNALQPIPGFGKADAFFTVFSSSAEKNDEDENLIQFDASCEIAKKIKIRNSDPEIIELTPSLNNSKHIVFKYHWSEEQPLTPLDENLYKGSPVYGGLYLEILNPSEKRKNLDRNEIGSPFSIHFSTKARENEQILMRAALFLTPSDFGAYKENSKFSFDINSYVEVRLDCSALYTYPWKNEEGKPTWKVHYWSNTEFRWMVKDSGKFYLSKKVEKWRSHQDNTFILSFTNDSEDGEWAEWKASDNLIFDPNSAEFENMNFENIEGVGIWLSDSEFRPTPESNNAGINKPAVVRSGIFLKSISATLACNKQTIKRPIAKFTASNTKPSINEEVNFDASTSEPGEGIINFYSWLFSGGYTTSGSTVKYNFKYLGPHNTILTVWNDKFQSSPQQVMRIEVFPENLNEENKNKLVCAFAGLYEKNKLEIERNDSVEITEIKDFDGDKIPDKKIELPFDDEKPFSPFPGTKIYAGWSVESKMPGGEKGETHINNALTISNMGKSNPALLTLGYRTRKEIPGKVDFIAMILKEDFLNGWNKNSNKLKLIKGTELIAGPFDQIPENGKMHFVIKDKDGYWVSDKFFSKPQNLKPNTYFSELPVFKLIIETGKDGPKWAKIDPFKSFQLPRKPTFIIK
ncbi:MAG TPA: PKD domain-containing protein, partial [Victivallales bacterium]|nr:PKD domain-containing protein [Victivallales bacterium]